MKVFGFNHPDYPRTDPPVDVSCLRCEEKIEATDRGFVGAHGLVFHRACFLRGFVGSVGHQLRRCACYGGDLEDPPNLTRRQAAEAAVELFEMQQLHTSLSRGIDERSSN